MISYVKYPNFPGGECTGSPWLDRRGDPSRIYPKHRGHAPQVRTRDTVSQIICSSPNVEHKSVPVQLCLSKQRGLAISREFTF